MPVFLPGESNGKMNLVGYTVHGVAKSWTWLSDWAHTHTFSRCKIMLLPTTSSSYVNIFYPGCWHVVNQPYLFAILLYQHVWFRFNFSFSGAFTSCCAQGMPDICSPKSQHPGDGLVSTAKRVLPRWMWGQHEWCKDPGLWCGWSPGDSIKSFLGVVVVPVAAGQASPVWMLGAAVTPATLSSREKPVLLKGPSFRDLLWEWNVRTCQLLRTLAAQFPQDPHLLENWLHDAWVVVWPAFLLKPQFLQ